MEQENQPETYWAELASRDDERNEHREYIQDAQAAAAEYERRHYGRKERCDICGEYGIVGEDLYAYTYMIGFCDYELGVRHRDACASQSDESDGAGDELENRQMLNWLCDQMEQELPVRCDECGALILPGVNGQLRIKTTDSYRDNEGAAFACELLVRIQCYNQLDCSDRVRLQEEGF